MEPLSISNLTSPVTGRGHTGAGEGVAMAVTTVEDFRAARDRRRAHRSAETKPATARAPFGRVESLTASERQHRRQMLAHLRRYRSQGVSNGAR
jgi:hypothetical protein